MSCDPVSGSLVINDELIVTTPDHAFYVDGRGWVEAAEIALGDQVPSVDGSLGVVTAMSWTRGPDLLYDLTVAEAHSFFVGDGGWLVHNCDVRSLRNPSSMTGASLEEVRRLIPRHWQKSVAQNGHGVRYTAPGRHGQHQIRIMRGKATNADPNKRGHYLRITISARRSPAIPLKWRGRQ